MGQQEKQANALAKTEAQPSGAIETATAQAEAMARAEVEARYLVALKNPRDDDAVRSRLLKECKRPNFAAVAHYEMPRAGTTIKGLSIRFAEAARRISGNMATTVQTVFQDDEQQILRVASVDFETNAIDIEEVVVPRYKEVRSIRQGDEVVGQRMNSTGQTVYKVRTTDDDHRMKRRSETQRAKRNGILALLPGDLIDECKTAIDDTIYSDVAEDPDAYRKKIVDSFAGLNVPVEELRDYLGHDIGQASPAQLAELGAVYQTVKDGEGNWRDCLAAKTGVVADSADDPNKELKKKIADKAAKAEKSRAAKGSGKGKAKAKASGKGEPRPDPDVKHTDEEAAAMKAKIEAGLTDEEIVQGWEVDPQTGDKVPPPGSEG